MNIFQAQEIFNIAVKIEENGERFYQHAMTIADNDETKKLFKHLVDEEASHKKTFADLQKQLPEFAPAESYPGEYKEYLNAFVENVLFPQNPEAGDFTNITNSLAAIRFAIQKELDSIYYYKEIKAFIPASHQASVEEIIEEERRHFMQLIKLEKTLG
jgi:rubrerythrin